MIGSSAVRALRESDYKIIGCDTKKYSTVLDMVDKYYQVPAEFQAENYINFLKKVIQKENVGFILPISEPEIEVINQRRDEIEPLGVKLLLNNSTIIDNFLDKLKTVQYLENIDVRVPKTMPLSIYDGSFGYPIIIKARKGWGSKSLWKAENTRDLEYIKYKDDGALIVQEYIGNDDEEYTTGVFSDGNVASSISFKRTLGFGGLSIEAALVDEPFLDDLAQHIAKEVKLIGSINIQTRKAGNIFMPHEINPRLSSTLIFRKRFGFNDALWWVEVLDGKGYSYKKQYKSGRALRGLTEHYFDLEKAE